MVSQFTSYLGVFELIKLKNTRDIAYYTIIVFGFTTYFKHELIFA